MCFYEKKVPFVDRGFRKCDFLIRKGVYSAFGPKPVASVILEGALDGRGIAMPTANWMGEVGGRGIPNMNEAE